MTGTCLVLAVALAAMFQRSRTYVFVVAAVTQWGPRGLWNGKYLLRQFVGALFTPNVRVYTAIERSQ